jgi:predicted nucleic acid-binding protein
MAAGHLPGLVIDASIVVAGMMPDEDSAPARAALSIIGEAGALAPMIWRLVVANALLAAERRNRIDPRRRKEALALAAALPIEADFETWDHAWDTILPLAQRFGLTAYDAAYLELAHRTGLPLATLDDDLRAAAAKLGVALLEG